MASCYRLKNCYLEKSVISSFKNKEIWQEQAACCVKMCTHATTGLVPSLSTPTRS